MAEFDDGPHAEIRSDDGESQLAIVSYGYAYPGDLGGWDADWHVNRLTCRVPGFRSEIRETMVLGSELEQHWREMQEFDALARATVAFEPLEPYYQLGFRLTSQKKVLVQGWIQYPAGWGSQLEFEFETNLTYVAEYIRGLNHILRTYPVRR